MKFPETKKNMKHAWKSPRYLTNTPVTLLPSFWVLRGVETPLWRLLDPRRTTNAHLPLTEHALVIWYWSLDQDTTSTLVPVFYPGHLASLLTAHKYKHCLPPNTHSPTYFF